MKGFARPGALRPGNKIALLTPATVVKEEYLLGGEAAIRAHGYEPVRMPGFAVGADGRFAGSADTRLHDLLTALENPDIKAIWCGRGGYGAVQLISRVPLSLVAKSPKWLIGFSDVCALHSLWLRAGVQALHAPMFRRLSDHPADEITEQIFALLGGLCENEADGAIHPLQQCGVASGRLIGGNVSVLGDLAATPFDQAAILADEPFILLIEDVAESLSRLQRRLWRLRLSGLLNRAEGIVVGQFTACPGGVNFSSAEEMIADLLREWHIDCPVAYNFPAGHDDCNLPLLIGARTRLEVTPYAVALTQESI